MSSSKPIALEAHLELDKLSGLAKEILEPLQQGEPLLLDGSGVQSIDGAAIQMLLAAVRAANQKNLPCNWHQPSAALKAAAALLGVTDELLLEATET
ncbi:MAG TPA: STAS domain-containing protein [Chromatiaceae bacterium]|nr:STAS domain-containing protein [Chromatiaceae bacterium]